MVTNIQTAVRFDDLNKLFSIVLYINLVVIKGIQLSNNELSVLSLFIKNNNKQDVIAESVSKGYVKSVQSGENTVSRLVKLKLLIKEKTNSRKISPDVISGNIDEQVLVNIVLHNITPAK
jgi:hypothetical protein